MGIKNLNKFLRNNCADIFEEIHISEYSFKKVAIDISLYLCKYKSICGDNWLSAFLNLISCLRRNEVHCIFIYDNGSPPEKEQEKKERAIQRQKLIEKVRKFKESLEKFVETGILDNSLNDLYNKKKYNTPKRLLSTSSPSPKTIDTDFLRQIVQKMESQILNITSQDFQMTKNLFNLLNVPYCNAPLEAETSCSDLCKRGLVDAVLSEDTDVLAYASPIFLSKINTTTDTCIRINYKKMIEKLNLKSSQFLDLCIMCGTDYNKNIFRVGPETAYKLIQKYETLENIEKDGKLNTSILNFRRGRELFREYKQKNIKIPYCGSPNFKLLENFMKKNKISGSMEKLKRAFTSNSAIIFVEE